MRPEFGVVMPFRAAEIHECGFPLDAGKIRRLAVSYPADRDEASFECDDDRLNKVWDFCRHSMFATSFAGQFVDGDRERIPYEADAFASQMNWYAVSSDCAYPRKSVEHLYSHPTWPTEFRQVSVLSAWADWMWSGDASSLRRNYATLKNEKLLLPWRRGDGLLRTGGARRSAGRFSTRRRDSSSMAKARATAHSTPTPWRSPSGWRRPAPPRGSRTGWRGAAWRAASISRCIF